MKLVVFAVAAVLAVASAAPPPPQQYDQVPIVRSDFENHPDGGYNFQVETGNGIKWDEVGQVKPVTGEDNKPGEVVIAQGSYSYVDPEGKSHNVVYTADEFGFHAESDDIPK